MWVLWVPRAVGQSSHLSLILPTNAKLFTCCSAGRMSP